MTKRRHCVLAVAGDPGGAMALRPVLELLDAAPDIRLLTFARDQAIRAFEEAGLAVRTVPPSRQLPSWLTAVVSRETPKLVLTASSYDPWLEIAFIRTAKRLGVRCLTLLDSWSHYQRRFLLSTEDEYDADLLPDRLLVMDEHARREIEELGFPVHRLEAVGQPSFDSLIRAAHAPGAAADRERIRRELAVADGRSLVVFFSQPISRMSGPPRGYDEFVAIRCLEHAVSPIEDRLAVVVKLHPKEDQTKFSDVLRARSPWKIRAGQFSSEELVLAADIVVGMTSIALVQAYLVGRPVISLQPNSCAPDPLMLTRAGYVDIVPDQTTLRTRLRRLVESGDMLPPRRELPDILTDGRATQRALEAVRSQLHVR